MTEIDFFEKPFQSSSESSLNRLPDDIEIQNTKEQKHENSPKNNFSCIFCNFESANEKDHKIHLKTHYNQR